MEREKPSLVLGGITVPLIGDGKLLLDGDHLEQAWTWALEIDP
jgi:hypothetical protein